MSRARLPFVFCVILATTPSLAQAPPCSGSPSEVQACQHARHDALKSQRDANTAQQRAAGEAEQARLRAAEDAELAPLRANIGSSLGGAPCVDRPANDSGLVMVDGKPYSYTSVSFNGDVRVAEHDTLQEVAADREEAARIRTLFDTRRCYALRRTGNLVIDAAFYRRLVASVPDLGTKLRDALARREAQDVKDEQCIAAPACMTKRFADRAANAACGAIAMHAAAQAGIASEQSYGRQSGAVDLVKLHDLGDELRISDEQLAAAKARYLELAKKPFDRSLCGR